MNRTLNTILGFSFSLLFFISCKTGNVPVEKLTSVIEMKKQPCFGNCPVYDIVFYENGLIQYTGKQYVEMKGVHIKKMNINDLRKLVKEFEEANFFEFNSTYRAPYPDLQTISITFTNEGLTKTITGKSEGRPEEILALEAKLDAIITAPGWQSQEGQTATGNQKPQNEIIVQVLKNTNMEEWIEKFEEYGATVVESLSPSGTYWLINFNPEKVTPESMLEKLRNDESVVGAELNTTADMRF